MTGEVAKRPNATQLAVSTETRKDYTTIDYCTCVSYNTNVATTAAPHLPDCAHGFSLAP
jgi:hypothetical protein